MKSLRVLIGVTWACGVFGVGTAHAVNITGTISSTLTIFEDSQLVGDVTCAVAGASCIAFGTDHMTLRLNGFTMTGLADPITGCGPASADTVPLENGITTLGHSFLQILGPGLVQNFRRNAISVNNGSTKVTVRHVTASNNCITGILLINGASDNDVEENVAVRTGHFQFACGGIELIRAHNNRIRRNETSGNGYALKENDFGIGILVDSSGNLVEENSAVGNTNGIRLEPATSGNIVRRNVVIGNPPLQVSLSFRHFGGVDIQNLSAPGANTFEDNLCMTSLNAPCPNFPNFAGHRNTVVTP